MSAESVAREHLRRHGRLADAIARLARQIWERIDPGDLDGSWARYGPELVVGLAGAQLAAAGSADDYVGAELAEQGAPGGSDLAVNPSSLAGIASDGRPLDSLLLNAITVVKAGVASGAPLPLAMAAGYANLDMLVQTQVADAGRAADQVSLVAHRSAHGYVRMVNAGACGRCVVLAGKFYRWNAGFLRHPRCHCVNVPAAEDHLGDVRTDPRKFFDSLSPAEQDKQFTKAGAQAIREGADIGQVVNARRGAYGLATGGGRLQTRDVFGRQLFTTTEGTTARGVAGRVLAGRAPRLMPESIYKIAGNDREEAIRLLRRNGYLRDAPRARSIPRPAVPKPAPVVKTFEQRAAEAASGQRAVDAPTFGLDRRPRPAGFTDQMYDAVNYYSSSGFHPVNRYLRGQRIPHGYLAADVHRNIAGLDAAMAASTLDREILTYRGILDGTPMFGDRLDGDLVGMVWREDAFVSTTADKEMTTLFFIGARGPQKPMLLRILTPAGTPAMEITNMRIEAEVLLGRGLRLRVVADRGVDPDGVRHIDAEVLRD